MTPTDSRRPSPAFITRADLRVAARIVLDALMLVAVLALWNNNAPPFIYVAF
jgi:hypothetical protein